MKEDIRRRLAQLSDEELLDLVENRHDEYRLDALAVAKEELARRQVHFSETHLEQVEQQREEAIEQSQIEARTASLLEDKLLQGGLLGVAFVGTVFACGWFEIRPGSALFYAIIAVWAGIFFGFPTLSRKNSD